MTLIYPISQDVAANMGVVSSYPESKSEIEMVIGISAMMRVVVGGSRIDNACPTNFRFSFRVRVRTSVAKLISLSLVIPIGTHPGYPRCKFTPGCKFILSCNFTPGCGSLTPGCGSAHRPAYLCHKQFQEAPHQCQ